MRLTTTGILAIGLLLMGLSASRMGYAGTEAPAAPAFDIVTLQGDSYSRDSLKGQPALLIFWAPWCQVCQRELPELAKFYQNDRPKPLRLLSIGFADLRTNVESFVKTRSEIFVFPTSYDEDRWLAQTFKVNATPTYVVLDANGRIVLTHRGGGVLQNPQFRSFLSTIR